MFGLDNDEDFDGPEAAPLVRFNSELDLDQKVVNSDTLASNNSFPISHDIFC